MQFQSPTPRKNVLLRLGCLTCVVLLTAITFTACDSDSNADPEWELVWQDEFDGPANQSPDPAKWDYDLGTNWGNAQLEYDTDRPENVSLDGQGNLVITARRESFQGQPYTSARIVTRGLFEQTYGRYEARIQMPSGAGMWPAFWLLGGNCRAWTEGLPGGDVLWPQCGEIDVMEYRGQEPSIVHGSLHGPGYSGGQAVTRAYTIPQARFDTDFYVFAVEWGEDYIDWYVDDVRYQSVKASDLPGEWVYDHPFYIILNLAVGGNYVGPPNANTSFPQTMIVDYVRVYRDAS